LAILHPRDTKYRTITVLANKQNAIETQHKAETNVSCTSRLTVRIVPREKIRSGRTADHIYNEEPEFQPE